MAHGTDIRIPSLHRQRTEWSPYADSTVYLEGLEKRARKNVGFLTSIENEVFVSTPDLLLDLPTATWCPVVVDIDTWALSEQDSHAGSPLRVVHAPSVQTMKGTQLIEPVLRELEAAGIIEYRPLQGIPSHLMPKEISWADVVLDQFRLGSYGVAACEAMAAGKIVVGHIIPEVRQIVHENTGMSVPVIEATPQSLSDVLQELAQSSQQISSLQVTSREFVGRVHSGHRSAEILMNNWLDHGSSSVTGGVDK
jgi:glycosyltransferase involved in cell wall biosynthesis